LKLYFNFGNLTGTLAKQKNLPNQENLFVAQHLSPANIEEFIS